MPGKRKLGSVYHRKAKGLWSAAVSLPDGRRVERYVERDHPDPERGAHELLAKLITELGAGDLLPAGELTVAEWMERYLQRANRGKAFATIRDREYTTRHITAGLGKVRLDRLTPARIQHWIDRSDLNHTTLLKTVSFLRSALRDAVALGHLTRNPADVVRTPRQVHVMKGVAWTPEQARQFLAANEDTGYILLWRLGLQTGARIGELLGLKVSDFDSRKAMLRIERTVKVGPEVNGKPTIITGPPKTVNATRSFRLPPDAVATIEAQLARVARLKKEAGPFWQEGGWLFPSEVGTLIRPDNARHAWREAIHRAQELELETAKREGRKPDLLPVIRTHDLRHTFISLALRRGVKPEVVSRMVGHSSPLITMRIYRQVFEEELDEAGEMIAELI